MQGWTVLGQRGLPVSLHAYEDNAGLVDRFDDPVDDSDFFFAAVGPQNAWPLLVVRQRFSPCQGGFDPGIALVPATRTVFIGAGTRLLAYRVDERPVRLWEDVASFGFWGWSVHDGVVLMSAELELAAWDLQGAKLWSRLVEPPWSYAVVNDRVYLDVMGATADFDILAGP